MIPKQEQCERHPGKIMPLKGVTVGTTTEPTERMIMEVSGSQAHLPLYSPPCEIKVCTYWISWHKTHYIADLIRSGSIDTRGQWQRLKRVCTEISEPKKHFLFDVCRSAGLADGSISYLFNGWVPTTRKVNA